MTDNITTTNLQSNSTANGNQEAEHGHSQASKLPSSLPQPLKGSESDAPDKPYEKELAKIDIMIARETREKKYGKMNLLTESQIQKLYKNFLKNDAIIQHSSNTIDFKPIVKLFTPCGACTWLLTELSEDYIAFGLCDLGFGEPELGYVDLKELQALKGFFGPTVERDRYFVADKTLSEYAKLARQEGSINA